MLLRCALKTALPCDGMLLQSPWTPVLEGNEAALAHKKIPLRLFCGERDEDCLPVAQSLASAIPGAVLTVQPGLYHQFPEFLGPEYDI